MAIEAPASFLGPAINLLQRFGRERPAATPGPPGLQLLFSHP